MPTESEDEISEMYEQFTPHGPSEYARTKGCYLSVNKGRWARIWWARDWVLGPIGRIPK